VIKVGNKIHAEEMKIEEVLTGNSEYYKIPDYQRRFSWKREQLEDFWFDLNSLEADEEHFLGSIVVITGAHNIGFNELELVDGQQRLTTIMLLLKNIQKKFKDNQEYNEMAKMINANYLFTKNKKAKRRIQLELGKLDHSDYENIMNDNMKSIDNQNLINAYKFFEEKLSKMTEKEIEEVYDKLLEQILVVLIQAQNEKSAFRLFETLNDRGLELSAIDLMKNYLLKVANNNEDVDTDLIKENWENIILNIQDVNRKVRFFRHYIMSSEPVTNSKITQRRVYDRFKEIINEDLADYNLTIEDYIKNMEEKSELYRNINNANIGDDFFTKNQRTIINDHLNNFNAIGALPARTLLLKAFDQTLKKELSVQDLTSILEYIETFSIRRIVGQLATGELDTIYNYLAVNAFSEDNPELFIKNYFKKNMPSDSEFENNFKERDFRNNDQTKYILDTFEKKHFMKNAAGKSIKERSEVHIEHIAPTSSFTAKKYKKWADYLDVDKAEFENLKTRIGNLTLLEYKLNIRASNKPFKQKKERYDESSFKMTEEIIKNYSEWKSNSILQRSEELSKIAVDIWSL
jgi:uncharacterized protein with ParB-like and HNH nuclease domain